MTVYVHSTYHQHTYVNTPLSTLGPAASEWRVTTVDQPTTDFADNIVTEIAAKQSICRIWAEETCD